MLTPPPGSNTTGKVGRGRASGSRRRRAAEPGCRAGGGPRGHVDGGGEGRGERGRGAPARSCGALPSCPGTHRAAERAADPTYLSPGQ